MRLSAVLPGAVLGLCLVLGSAATSNAAVVGVTSFADLGADDSLDWGQLGPATTWINKPATVTSGWGGLTASVDTAGTGFQRIDQGSPAFNGNFAAGTALLWTSGQGPDITIDLSQPVYGAGAQIQSNWYGAFTAQIQELDGIGNVIASFTENGLSNAQADGSAIFIGLKSSLQDITRLRFILTSASKAPNDFAIGPVALAKCAAVPEPATWVTLLTGFAGLGAMLRAKRRAKARTAASS